MELNLVFGLGIIFAVVGLGMLFNSRRYARMYAEVRRGVYSLYLGGFMALIFGLFITALNIQVDWRTTTVAVLGWLAIIKGVAILVFPSFALKLAEVRAKVGMIILVGIIALLLGLALLFL